jgi:hypothetical protein
MNFLVETMDVWENKIQNILCLIENSANKEYARNISA